MTTALTPTSSTPPTTWEVPVAVLVRGNDRHERGEKAFRVDWSLEACIHNQPSIFEG